jgi:hypothetical protein
MSEALHTITPSFQVGRYVIYGYDNPDEIKEARLSELNFSDFSDASVSISTKQIFELMS